MKKPLFTGACTALVTPFINGQINHPMVQILLQRQIEAGIEAIVISGTTGESATLSDSEKLELFQRCKSIAGSRCCIIAGTGSNNTSHAIELSKAAEQSGVDALLVVSPYYNKATTEGLLSHFAAIANSVSIPIILYNVPSRTGLDIPVSVYKHLSAVPNIIGVKEAATDITKIIRIRRECPPDFAVWAGNDDQTVPVMSLGGQGVISVASNVLPMEVNAMVNAAHMGDFDTAAALQCQLLPLIDALFCEVNPVPVKEAMKLIGYDCGSCRLPLSNMSKENRKRLESCLH